MSLPITQVLDDLLRVLAGQSSAVLVAPPGAGKTTAVAPALLDQNWCDGQILLLSPRRLAARAAAERMAETLGSPVGELVGYATRMDSKQSRTTRILVMTEGIFRNRVRSEPDLPGVSAVLFDEVHERSLDSDFGLALALDAQAGFRPDLRLLAMSATLDGARFAALMGDAPVIESEGKAHPLELRHIGRRAELRIEQDMADAVRRALAEEEGDILAFLPGVAEIERTADNLEAKLDSAVRVHRLHGSLEPAEQRRAIRLDPDGKRKIILATSIAETSLTIDGVRVVIDSGLARRPRYDRSAGVTRLVTEKSSQASATQRAGRAARQRPGVVYRLWEAAATAGLPPYDPPEILESDLSALLLDCADWGVSDPSELRWIDPPPKAAVDEARTRLSAMGALDEKGRITPHGRAIAALPLAPRLAHMLIRAGEMGLGQVAAQIAVLLGERGLGGTDTDLSSRLARWKREKGGRSDSARSLARRWARLVNAGGETSADDHAVGQCLALAFPDRVSRRRSADGADWISAGGRGFRLDPTHSLAREEWLAVAEVQGASAGARIISAAPLSQADVETLFADRIEVVRTVRYRPDNGGVEALRQTRLGAIAISSGSDPSPDPEAIVATLVEAVRSSGLALLPWPQASVRLRARAGFAGLSGLDDAGLLADLDDWLPPLLKGKRRLGDIDPGALAGVLDMKLGWDERKKLDALAPEMFATPAGSHHAIDYEAHGGPEVEVRVQGLYGLAEHPCVGTQRIPLRLSLTSPAGRPIQTTGDLPGFWAGSWKDVAKEMRGRYPKHNWPEDPTAAVASLRTKKATERSKT